jgi:hypothetical protein
MARPLPRRSARTERRFALTGVLLAGVCLLGAGCTAASGSVSSSATGAAALPAGVSVRVYQTRFDYAERVLELSVENAGGSAFDLRGASFVSSRFAAPADWSEPIVLEPGMTRDLRVRLPAAVCSGGGDAGEDSVSVTWFTPAGITTTASVVPLDDTGALDRITGEDCLNRAVEDVVTAAAATALRVIGAGTDSVALLDITLTPTGGPGSVTVERIGATVLLASAEGLDWPVGVSIAAASPPTVITLELRPARCDPHAVAEDKRGTVFPLAVVADGPGGGPRLTGSYDLPVPNAVRAQIYDWLATRCGY